MFRSIRPDVQDSPDQTLELSLSPPDTWTEQDAEQLLTYQLEVACDTGTASTSPLALSSEALMALQREEFRMPGPKVVRLEG